MNEPGDPLGAKDSLVKSRERNAVLYVSESLGLNAVALPN